MCCKSGSSQTPRGCLFLGDTCVTRVDGSCISNLVQLLLRRSCLHAELSFGCASYLIKRPEGNILVDVPRYVPKLVNRIKVCCTGCQYTHKSSSIVRVASYVKQRAQVVSTPGCMQGADTVLLSSRQPDFHTVSDIVQYFTCLGHGLSARKGTAGT